jgi:hypothetical protein
VEARESNDDGFEIGDNVKIKNSWCHDLVISSGPHSDSGQTCSGVRAGVISGNWLDANNKDADGNNGQCLISDITIRDNWLRPDAGYGSAVGGVGRSMVVDTADVEGIGWGVCRVDWSSWAAGGWLVRRRRPSAR